MFSLSLTPVTFFFTSGVFPLQDEKVTNIVAAMSSPKLNTFFIKFFISIIHIQVYKKERHEE